MNTEYDCVMSHSFEEAYRRLNIIESITKLGYWEYNTKTKIMSWSKQLRNILGYDDIDISHKKNEIKSRIHPDDLPLYKSKIFELLRQHQPVSGTIRIIRKNDKKIIHCAFNTEITQFENQNIIIGTFQDLSEMVEMQIALDKAKDAAEQSDIAKSYFLAQASHDLRQPLQALRIFIHGLKQETLPLKQAKIVDKIEESTNNLNDLLSNLLDLSKFDAGGFHHKEQTFNISDLLVSIYNEFEIIAADKNVIVKFVNCEQKITTDPVLLERIVRNLLSNALKYTSSKILFACQKTKKTVKISVTDNGPGIGQNEIKSVFDDFYQSDKIENNRKIGSGLGLPIVKKLSLILDGNITVKSTLKKGSSFTLELPLRRKT